jgi:hypothetical protein
MATAQRGGCHEGSVDVATPILCMLSTPEPHTHRDEGSGGIADTGSVIGDGHWRDRALTGGRRGMPLTCGGPWAPSRTEARGWGEDARAHERAPGGCTRAVTENDGVQRGRITKPPTKEWGKGGKRWTGGPKTSHRLDCTSGKKTLPGTLDWESRGGGGAATGTICRGDRWRCKSGSRRGREGGREGDGLAAEDGGRWRRTLPTH